MSLSGFEQRWRERFERYGATEQDDAGIAGWSENGLQVRRRHFGRQWRERPGGLWLDAGCGAGTYCRFLLEHGQRVVGLDYSLSSLGKARARTPGEGRWVLGDVNRLPLKPGLFDGVICYGVMQALSDSRAAVHELAAMVRPGGELWIDALNAWSLVHMSRTLYYRLTRTAPRVRCERAGRLGELLRGEGFVGVRVQWVPIAPAGWERLQSLLESAPARWLLDRMPLAGPLAAHAVLVRGRRASTAG